MQGAQCGTQSWDLGITLWAEGRLSTIEPLRHPNFKHFFKDLFIYDRERHRRREKQAPCWEPRLAPRAKGRH